VTPATDAAFTSADAGLYDGTVGKACMVDSDCQPAGGPGVNRCTATINPGGDPEYPNAVCIIQGGLQTSCEVGTDNGLHFCDGPDNSNSPGLCVGNEGSTGACLPKCLAQNDGSAPIGCIGHDACLLMGWALDSMNNPVGIGYCTAGCTADSDCPAGSSCQKDDGTCVVSVVPRTKTIGEACTEADDQSGACFCLATTATSTAYCTQTCIVGSMTNPCPAGYLCDASEATMLPDAQGALTVPGFTTQAPGLLGICLAACSVADAAAAAPPDAAAADAGSTAGGGCPATTTCQTGDVPGPDCQPPQ
jgi:hypothetical protein